MDNETYDFIMGVLEGMGITPIVTIGDGGVIIEWSFNGIDSMIDYDTVVHDSTLMEADIKETITDIYFTNTESLVDYMNDYAHMM